MSERDTIIREREAVAAAQRWIPVGERLPDNDAPVLVVIGRRAYIAQYYRGHGSGFYADAHAIGPVTHWQELPTIPGELF